ADRYSQSDCGNSRGRGKDQGLARIVSRGAGHIAGGDVEAGDGDAGQRGAGELRELREGFHRARAGAIEAGTKTGTCGGVAAASGLFEEWARRSAEGGG